MNKRIIFSAIALALTAAVLVKSNSVLALDTGDQQTLVQRLAEKFSLNTEDVQAVFDEVSQERRTQMKADYETRLSQLVTDGKISENQKQLILTKHQEIETQMQADRAEWQNLSADERRARMEARHKELQEWASQNGLDDAYLMVGHMRMHGPKNFDLPLNR